MITKNARKALEAKRRASTKRMITETVNALLVTDTVSDAARLLKIQSPAMFRRMAKYPEIRERAYREVKVNVEGANMLLQKKAIEAVQVLSELLKSNKEEMRFKTAQEVLNKSGFNNKNTNVQVNILNQIEKDREEFDL